MAAFLHFLDAFRPVRSEVPVEDKPDTPNRPTVGLALSSGGAKGLAHIGVIQVLEENGIHVDAIAGTSMGAYVGGLWASGLYGKELEALATSMTSARERWTLVDPVIPPRRGFVRGNKILARLRESLGDTQFEDLKTPFVAIATEFESLERAVLDSGELATAILASLAVPGVVVPVVREGLEYMDGGVCDPLPVRILKEKFEVDTVIAVNVLPPIGSLRAKGKRKENPGPWKRLMQSVNRHVNYFAPGNLLDILRGAAMGSQMRLVARSAAAADVVISAMSVETGWHDYHRFQHYIDVGREAATRALPEIFALLNRDNKSPDSDDSKSELAPCA